MEKLRVLLVRHGQSEANLDWKENKRKPDHAIPLTGEGHRQAQEVGKFLAEYLIHDPGPLPKIRLWNGPYTRTRQTADNILQTATIPEFVTESYVFKGLKPPRGSIFCDGKSIEHAILHEQQFGIFDGMTDEERAEKFPVEWAHYMKHKVFEGKVWSRHPGGESRMDVHHRMQLAFGTFHRDHDRHGISTIVIVAHGTVNRAFTMAWCNLPWEFLEKEPNPNNCSVRLLENSQDKGYIFDGFPP